MIRCCFIEQKLLNQRSATLWEKISVHMGREGVGPLISDYDPELLGQARYRMFVL